MHPLQEHAAELAARQPARAGRPRVNLSGGSRQVPAITGQSQHDSECCFVVIRPGMGRTMVRGAETHPKFEKVKPNTAKSTRGFTVQLIPHGGILYEDASGSLRVDSELLRWFTWRRKRE